MKDLIRAIQLVASRLTWPHFSMLAVVALFGVSFEHVGEWADVLHLLCLGLGLIVLGIVAQLAESLGSMFRRKTTKRRRSGEQLRAYLDKNGVKLADYERWRIALQDDERESATTTQRIRKLERELTRKKKALAETAALLVLKKR